MKTITQLYEQSGNKTIKDLKAGSQIKTANGDIITLAKVTDSRISWYNSEPYNTLGSKNKKAIALWISIKQLESNIKDGRMTII